ncbi:MAG TPA: hypothetical protein PKD00_05055 [Burkholderiales bacterium]|nr:hypothetical protein [Burkholderiales bacterium]
MLTYSKNIKLKRIDLPWLLVMLVFIWVLGTAFFHSPWEPYELFVFAVVKGIIYNHSWLVPVVSGVPYSDIQPFYFWIYSSIIKLFNISSIEGIGKSVRIINTLIIFAVIIISARIGSNLKAYKNGRSVILILISSIGFINNAYQISPNILILLGFCFYLYSLQLYRELPGFSSWLLFIGLILISINFTCEFVLIAIFILLLLPIIDKKWRNKPYLFTTIIGILLFTIIFYLYCYQLQQVDNEFFLQWKNRYTSLISRNNYNFWRNLVDTVSLLSWYVLPSWILVIWTIYKRRLNLFKDKIIQVNILLAILLFIFTVISGKSIDNMIFPIILPFTFIASIEVDSIRISIVSLLNWFSLFLFGILGTIIWFIYISFNIGMPKYIIQTMFTFSQKYHFKFNIWQLILAIIITLIWLFMITRRHIRGREMVTNWASGTTFALALFIALMLPWFDSVLTFKPIIDSSLRYINSEKCVTTAGSSTTQAALWYYYADINLIPSFINIDYSLCNQAIVATENSKEINKELWRIQWQAKRPIDKKIYYILKRK